MFCKKLLPVYIYLVKISCKNFVTPWLPKFSFKGGGVTYIGHYISTLYITYIKHYISALFNLSFMFIHCHKR